MARRQLLAGLVLLGGFAAWAAVASATDTSEWATSLTRHVHGRPDGWAVVLWPAMQLGNRLVALAVCGLVAWLVGRRPAVAVLAIVLVAWSAAILTKEVAQRPRPSAAELGGAPRSMVEGWGFPSSHATVAFALATAVALVWPRPSAWRYALVPVAVLAAVARMYYGVHFADDVAAGALLGTGVALTIGAVAPST
ncbi:MAG: phosphatase PAP2 family protein [Acidimicrobiia bacterium]|nr:phosphatase PAP2 family protein [Acidimicrobiia bacterium]